MKNKLLKKENANRNITNPNLNNNNPNNMSDSPLSHSLSNPLNKKALKKQKITLTIYKNSNLSNFSNNRSQLR